jgi:two-component system chemotaxis response regulator CheY
MPRTRQDSSTAETLTARGRILLVDDQPELRRLYRRNLTKLGYEVVEACNGRAAIELSRQQHFDVVISDVRMPDLSGVELLRAVYELDPDLPVVLMSGGMDDETERAAARYGAFAYLMKPVPFEHIQTSAAVAIELRREREAAHERANPTASHQRLRVPERRKP